MAYEKHWIAVLACVTMAAQAQTPRLTEEDYRRAQSMLKANAPRLIRNAAIAPHWLPDGNRFWYRRQTADGWQFMAVDPVHAFRGPAFDHQKVAAALSAAMGEAVDAAHLPLDKFEFTDSAARTIRILADEAIFTCDVLQPRCTREANRPQDPYALVSPDKHLEVFAKNDNLWLRDRAKGTERALTTAGERYFSYGKLPDTSLGRVLQQTKALRFPPFAVYWSPDSRHVVVGRWDERALPDYNFLQSLPYDGNRRPKVVALRTPLSGEDRVAPVETSIIDVVNSSIRVLDVAPEGFSEPLMWDDKGERFVGVVLGRNYRSAELYEVTVADGVAHQVFREDAKTLLQLAPLSDDAPAIAPLWKTREAIWFSQRDGWGHLYRIDLAKGSIKNAITWGSWSVQNIIDVDEQAQRLYFTGVGREPGQDPYLRHLYSVRFDGRDLRLLTPEAADHAFEGLLIPDFEAPVPPAVLISPSRRYLIDTFSTVATAPVSLLKRIDGKTVLPLERADAGAAVKAGWIAPEPFVAKAADGKTDVYGIIIKPAHFDSASKYPVLEHIYNGPQEVSTPHNYLAALARNGYSMQAQSFAQLGFFMVLLDGRGTPLRSKAFQDFMFNNMQSFGVEDHVAAIRELAKTRPYMDLERVGVFGHSFGGYASARAILGFPEFYKVAVSSAGPYDPYGMYPLDELFENPIFKGGASVPADPVDRPTNWGASDLTQQAGRLKGKWMIAYGDLDENAYPAVTVKMVNALLAANKDFDLLYLPNADHHFTWGPYFTRRRWDYFVRNLMGAEPPKEYIFERPAHDAAD